LPKYVVAALLSFPQGTIDDPAVFACGNAYIGQLDPVSLRPFDPSGPPTGSVSWSNATPPIPIPPGYLGFDPSSAPNDGQGFNKDLSGNELPNAPRFTVSLGGQYSIPLSTDWAATLRSDFYWQDASWARVFNDDPYDRIHGYSTVNLTLILTNQGGWQVMLYDKNVFNKTAITGTFLNSDDTALTTNVFLTDPKLIGIRVTKNW
jgi:outer membrane receptor protein involved in Fe transport